MSYNAVVLKVLIASPSDVAEDRNIIENAINSWNAVNSEHEKVVLLPVRWETHSTPEYSGVDTQGLLNEQFVKSCDMLVGAMWQKLGTPTKTNQSGTVEEIELLIELEKEILLYFSTKSLPNNVDVVELMRVRDFKQKYSSEGIYKEYDSHELLRELIKDDITRVVRKFKEVNHTLFDRLSSNEQHVEIREHTSNISSLVEVKKKELNKS